MFLFKALQGKHDALLQRIDELDQECEELREQVMDYEAERDELNEVLNETNNRSETLSKELATKQVRLVSGVIFRWSEAYPLRKFHKSFHVWKT